MNMPPAKDPPPSAPSAAPTEGRRARRRRELHEQIFQTAKALFAAQGVEATTVEQIAREADIAQATFFNHFPTKEHVLREMAGEVYELFQRMVAEQRALERTTRERLRGFATRAVTLIERAPELTRRVLLEELGAASGRRGSREGLTVIEADMAQLLADGRRSGDVRPQPDAAPLAEVTVSVVIGVMTKWIHDPTYPIHERMGQAIDLVADAVCLPSEGAPQPTSAET